MTTEPVQTWGSAEAAEAWRRGAPRRALALAAVTERMFEAAALRPGFRVLDVAAGTGDQSLLAARRVGPSGAVLATDISASMLAVAVAAAREAGLDNVTTRVADASKLDLADADTEDAFDAAISRFGLMFMPDLHQALGRIRRALKTGANFAAAVWSSAELNPYIGLQLNVVREMGRMPSPPPALELTVSLSAPGKLEHAFLDAGFRGPSVEAVPVSRAFHHLEDALTAMRANSAAGGELGRLMSDAEQAHYWAELGRRLQPYVQADGRCILPGEALVAVGTK